MDRPVAPFAGLVVPPWERALRAFRLRSPLAAAPAGIAVVGNGPIEAKLSDEIDDHDIVIRINRAPSCGEAGQRTDVLVLVNWSEPGFEFASNRGTINRRARKQAKEFWLTNHPNEVPVLQTGRDDENRRGDFTPEILNRVVQGRPYRFLGIENRRMTEALLRRYGARHDVIPSTGVQTVNFVRTVYPGARIDLYGFTHEGWSGHCWEAERLWLRTIIGANA